MCKDCGCEEGNANHAHHGHHQHKHDHSAHRLELGQKVLAENDRLAEQNRIWLHERGIVTLNLISAPGTGKTLLLEETLKILEGKVSCAVITGDQQTDNDAKRLQGKGAKVAQIETVNSCHLDAHRIAHALPEVIDEDTQLLFIENVGNLICPVAFDLGEDFKVALLSTTEGEDKPLKYPSLFSVAQVTVLTKTDLIPYLQWDLDLFREYIQRVHPGVYTFELSALTGIGMESWLDYLQKLVPSKTVK